MNIRLGMRVLMLGVKAKDCRTRGSTVDVAFGGFRQLPTMKVILRSDFTRGAGSLWERDRQMRFGRTHGAAVQSGCVSLWRASLGEDGSDISKLTILL